MCLVVRPARATRSSPRALSTQSAPSAVTRDRAPAQFVAHIGNDACRPAIVGIPPGPVAAVRRQRLFAIRIRSAHDARGDRQLSRAETRDRESAAVAVSARRLDPGTRPYREAARPCRDAGAPSTGFLTRHPTREFAVYVDTEVCVAGFPFARWVFGMLGLTLMVLGVHACERQTLTPAT